MKITKQQLRKIIQEELLKEAEEMSPEFSNSMEILGLAIRAKAEVEDARITGDANLDKLQVMLSQLVDRLPKALK